MTYWMLLIGMAILTYIPRYIPFALAGRIAIPPVLARALHYVPTAVLTCIIIKATLVHQGELQFSFENHYLIAAVVAFFTSLMTRNLLLTVIVGLACFGLMKWLFI